MKGLIECYTAALPFLGNTLSSQFIFGGLFFGFHKVCITNINYFAKVGSKNVPN
jgi:hypothetical protein